MKIIAKSLIKHNGVYFEAGQEVEGLTEKEISNLLAANSVEVKDGQISPAKPSNILDDPSDKTAEQAEIERVASLPISVRMTKEKLIGVARANGLEVDKTSTPDEVYQQISQYRQENGIVIPDVEPKPKAVNPRAPKKVEEVKTEDKKEISPSGEKKDEATEADKK